MKRFLIGYALLTTCLLFMQREAQKPLLVYHADNKYQITGKVTENWLLQNYAKAGDKILDTHVGSASSLIACQELGFEYVGCELDKRIFNLAKQRLDTYEKQIKLF